MNYIRHIKHIWNLRSQGVISIHEHDLYCYLLYRCCLLKNNPFQQSSTVTCAVLGINKSALTLRREKLASLGLINYQNGSGKKHPPLYELCPLPTGALKPRATVVPKPIKRLALEKQKAFRKPTVSQIAAYCSERQNGIDPQRFYDFYESKNWFVGHNKMRNWQAAIRTWESNDKQRQSNFAKHDNTIKYAQF